MIQSLFFFFSSRRRHTRWPRDWSSDVCSSDLVENTGHAHHRIELEERERRRRIVEIDPARPALRLQLPRQRVRIHFEADCERRLRAHPRTDTAVSCTGDRLMQLERIAPPSLVTEGIETKDLPAQVDCGLRLVVHFLVVF